MLPSAAFFLTSWPALALASSLPQHVLSVCNLKTAENKEGIPFLHTGRALLKTIQNQRLTKLDYLKFWSVQ